MAHFHGPAAAGKNGPPAIWLSPKGSRFSHRQRERRRAANYRRRVVHQRAHAGSSDRRNPRSGDAAQELIAGSDSDDSGCNGSAAAQNRVGRPFQGRTKPCPAVPGPGPRHPPRHWTPAFGWHYLGSRSAAIGTCRVFDERIRANADECLDWARTARTDRERQIFLQMARAWLEAATRREGASQLAQAPGGCDDQNLTTIR